MIHAKTRFNCMAFRGLGDVLTHPHMVISWDFTGFYTESLSFNGIQRANNGDSMLFTMGLMINN